MNWSIDFWLIYWLPYAWLISTNLLYWIDLLLNGFTDGFTGLLLPYDFIDIYILLLRIATVNRYCMDMNIVLIHGYRYRYYWFIDIIDSLIHGYYWYYRYWYRYYWSADTLIHSTDHWFIYWVDCLLIYLIWLLYMILLYWLISIVFVDYIDLISTALTMYWFDCLWDSMPIDIIDWK